MLFMHFEFHLLQLDTLHWKKIFTGSTCCYGNCTGYLFPLGNGDNSDYNSWRKSEVLFAFTWSKENSYFNIQSSPKPFSHKNELEAHHNFLPSYYQCKKGQNKSLQLNCEIGKEVKRKGESISQNST